MDMPSFVSSHSIVRRIWGKSDTILFIFAGAAAEFALNKAVDWLYFTGRLPSDPLGRLFSTVNYARRIVFSSEEEALKAIDTIAQIHKGVESKRGDTIPDWAYRDVLFMLIHYSIASFELLERKLTEVEKDDVYDVFYRMGSRLGLKELPVTYRQWLPVRESHMQEDLVNSHFTKDLFAQYKKHLGSFRYRVLLEGQKLVVPPHVKALLGFSSFSLLRPVVPLYKLTKWFRMEWLLKNVLLPKEYYKEIRGLDVSVGVDR
jgi:hypothetical protein